mmetsp:Transcript_13080/g.46518  ORF Transcript_13080/g.46518 Transcript_13080/m.46518 type:complete len:232 (-) Transcript_13080:1773-2468(-)
MARGEPATQPLAASAREALDLGSKLTTVGHQQVLFRKLVKLRDRPAHNEPECGLQPLEHSVVLHAIVHDAEGPQSPQGALWKSTHGLETSLVQARSCQAGLAICDLEPVDPGCVAILVHKLVIAVIQGVRLCVEGVMDAAAHCVEVLCRSSGQMRIDAVDTGCVNASDAKLHDVIRVRTTRPQRLIHRVVRGPKGLHHRQLVVNLLVHPAEKHLTSTAGGLVHRRLHLLGC